MKKYRLVFMGLLVLMIGWVLVGCSSSQTSESGTKKAANQTPTERQNYGFMIMGEEAFYTPASNNVQGEGHVLNGICTETDKHYVYVHMEDGTLTYIPTINEAQENSFAQGDTIQVENGQIASPEVGSAKEGAIALPTSGYRYMVDDIANAAVMQLAKTDASGSATVITGVCTQENSHGVLAALDNGSILFVETTEDQELTLSNGASIKIDNGKIA